MKVTRGETKIEYQHLEGTIEAIHPFYRGNLFHLTKQIPDEEKPTTGETTSLIYDAYKNPNDDIQISNEVKSIMKRGLFYFHEGILFLPKKEGVLFQYNPQFSKNATSANDLIMNRNDLMSRLGLREEGGVIFSDDNSIAFVKGYDFQIGKHNPGQLRRNPTIIASQRGKEGAEKIDYIGWSTQIKTQFIGH